LHSIDRIRDNAAVRMPQLFFKRHLQEAIRAGTKRTTIRRWARPMMQAGQKAYAPGLGWLEIEAVQPMELDQLSDDEARVDGVGSARELRELLLALYPDHAEDGKRWFLVAFTPVDLEPRRGKRIAPEPADPY
jgi:hypothetical protein